MSTDLDYLATDSSSTVIVTDSSITVIVKEKIELPVKQMENLKDINDKAFDEIVKEMVCFNNNFEKYKNVYMDEDDVSTKNDIKVELLEQVKLILECEEKKVDFRSFTLKRNKKIQKECPICLEGMERNKDTCKLGCGHTFHLSCIFELKGKGERYSNICPLCRTKYCEKSDRELNDDDAERRIHEMSVRMNSEVGNLIHRITHIDNTDAGNTRRILADNNLSSLRRIMDNDNVTRLLEQLSLMEVVQVDFFLELLGVNNDD